MSNKTTEKNGNRRDYATKTFLRDEAKIVLQEEAKEAKRKKEEEKIEKQIVQMEEKNKQFDKEVLEAVIEDEKAAEILKKEIELFHQFDDAETLQKEIDLFHKYEAENPDDTEYFDYEPESEPEQTHYPEDNKELTSADLRHHSFNRCDDCNQTFRMSVYIRGIEKIIDSIKDNATKAQVMSLMEMINEAKTRLKEARYANKKEERRLKSPAYFSELMDQVLDLCRNDLSKQIRVETDDKKKYKLKELKTKTNQLGDKTGLYAIEMVKHLNKKIKPTYGIEEIGHKITRHKLLAKKQAEGKSTVKTKGTAPTQTLVEA